MSKVICNESSVSQGMFETIADMLLHDYYPGDKEYDVLAELIAGAHTQLDGFTFKGLFLREYRGDYDQEGGYMRYVEMPLETYINTNGSEVMPEFERNGWPLEGVTCTHSYSPCGNLYCSPATMIRNETMMRFVQRVWRNV